MSKENSRSINSIKETLDDKDFTLFAFIAIGKDGCKQICYGAEDRSDLVKIVGEMQLFICDIYDRMSQSEKMDKIEALLAQARESTDEGEEDVRVLN